MADPATIVLSALATQLAVSGAKGAVKGTVESFEKSNKILQESFLTCIYVFASVAPHRRNYSPSTEDILSAVRKSNVDVDRDHMHMITVIQNADPEFLSAIVPAAAIAAIPAAMIIYPYTAIDGAVRGAWKGITGFFGW